MSRRLVLATLTGAAAPLSANDVYDALRSGSSRVALTTVYRVLHLLTRVGLVHSFAGPEQRYRLCSGVPHLHLVCEGCHAVVEQPVQPVTHWLDGSAARGFDIDLEHTTVYGLCVDCQRRVNRRSGLDWP